MPFGNALQGWHLVVIVLVILLLFGAPKLPGLAKSLGQSMRIFRKEVRTMRDENASDGEPASADEINDPANQSRPGNSRSSNDDSRQSKP